MHGSVFLDSSGAVIRPALLWNDQRTAAECQEIEQKAGGREALIRLVANPALTGFTAPKLLWVRKHEPKNWDRVRQVLLPKDYVRYRLTGTYATEVSDASGTLLLDVANRRWSRELLSRLEIDPALLASLLREPRSFGQGERAGCQGHRAARRACRWSAAAATSRPGPSATASCARAWSRRRWGPPESSSPTPIRSGSTRSGRLQRGCHAVPGAWHVMGVVLSAGGSFQWFRNELGKAEVAAAKAKGEDPYFLLTDEAALAGPGAEGLFFLPYLTGERTPHFDPDAKGAWVGLTVRHGRAHMIRSVLEGATFAMRDSLELIREMGVAIEQVRVSGGGARNALWRQIQADIYGCDVHTLNSTEGPGVRRRPAGPGGNGCVQVGSRGVRRHDPVGRFDGGRPAERRRFTTALMPFTGSSTSICAARSRRSASWWRKVNGRRMAERKATGGDRERTLPMTGSAVPPAWPRRRWH